MNDQDYIREAVELADGWEIVGDCLDNDLILAIGDRPEILSWSVSLLPQWAKDALAAQLVKQVDEMGRDIAIYIENGETKVGMMMYTSQILVNVSYGNGPDRTMNTIKAIIDSGVLKDGLDELSHL